MDLQTFLNKSYTAYQSVEEVINILNKNGFESLSESEKWKIRVGGKYYVTRNGSSLIAFKAGKDFSFNVIASHTDTPCLKIKNNPMMTAGDYSKINVERYGGAILSSFIDVPLKIAGRVIVEDGGTLKAKNVVSDYNITIPSVAIHMKTVESADLNAQTDMLPLAGLGKKDLLSSLTKEKVVDYDLFVASDQKPFIGGIDGELLCSPRLDNQTSVLSSVEALIATRADNIPVACMFDNEEVGSLTKQGADSTFLTDALSRIAIAYGKSEEELKIALSDTLFVSLDNAHAMHPNHPEKCDPTNECLLGKGIVVKHHSNMSYTTDGFSSAIIKKIFNDANVPYQDFYNRSDMRGGSTLGSISASHLSVCSVDLGIAQLSMHSSLETIAVKDYETTVKGLTAYYNSVITIRDGVVRIK